MDYRRPIGKSVVDRYEYCFQKRYALRQQKQTILASLNQKNAQKSATSKIPTEISKKTKKLTAATNNNSNHDHSTVIEESIYFEEVPPRCTTVSTAAAAALAQKAKNDSSMINHPAIGYDTPATDQKNLKDLNANSFNGKIKLKSACKINANKNSDEKNNDGTCHSCHEQNMEIVSKMEYIEKNLQKLSEDNLQHSKNLEKIYTDLKRSIVRQVQLMAHFEQCSKDTEDATLKNRTGIERNENMRRKFQEAGIEKHNGTANRCVKQEKKMKIEAAGNDAEEKPKEKTTAEQNNTDCRRQNYRYYQQCHRRHPKKENDRKQKEKNRQSEQNNSAKVKLIANQQNTIPTSSSQGAAVNSKNASIKQLLQKATSALKELQDFKSAAVEAENKSISSSSKLNTTMMGTRIKLGRHRAATSAESSLFEDDSHFKDVVKILETMKD